MYIIIIGKKRKRCDTCDACLRPDCGHCKYCLDKPKFGGTNTLKQYCAKQRCLQGIHAQLATFSFLVKLYPKILATKRAKSTSLQSAGDSQAATEDDCIVTDFSCPDKQLSLLELRQQRLLNRSVSDTTIKYTTGKLTRLDFDTIRTGGMLTDKHIMEASHLLKQQFPNVKSLQSPCYGQDLSFQATGSPFVQVLHVQGLHWITVYAVHYGLIFIYDSMPGVISDAVQIQAAAILKSSRSNITFEAQRTIPQEGVKDCGLFAIAYATDLCIGNNPAAYRCILLQFNV